MTCQNVPCEEGLLVVCIRCTFLRKVKATELNLNLQQSSMVEGNIYTSTLLKYSLGVLELELGISTLCYFLHFNYTTLQGVILKFLHYSIYLRSSFFEV